MNFFLLREDDTKVSRHDGPVQSNGYFFFFRPSPSRLSPGRNTVFVPVERIVQSLASFPLWGIKREHGPVRSPSSPIAMRSPENKNVQSNGYIVIPKRKQETNKTNKQKTKQQTKQQNIEHKPKQNTHPTNKQTKKTSALCMEDGTDLETMSFHHQDIGWRPAKTNQTTPTSPKSPSETCKEEATQHYAETRASPSQEPRNHSASHSGITISSFQQIAD